MPDEQNQANQPPASTTSATSTGNAAGRTSGQRQQKQQNAGKPEAEKPKATGKPEVTEKPEATVRPVLRVTAAAGPRRRAGLAFGRTPVELTPSQLGNDDRERAKTIAALEADPMLSVVRIGKAD